VPWPTLITAAGVTIVLVFLILGLDGPYRADHDYWAAYTSLKQPAAGSTTSSTQATQVGPVYFANMKHALTLNPWEPSYPIEEAQVYVGAGAHSTASTALSDLSLARSLSAKAVAEKPLWGPYAAAEATVYLDLARVEPSAASADLATAAALARKAIHDNPRDSQYQTILTEALAGSHHKSSKSGS
jgi:hypothetical protein